MSTQPKRRERRLRLRHKDDIMEGWCKINPETAKELGIETEVEIVVKGGGGAGPKRFVLKAIGDSNVPRNEVWANAEQLKSMGIADNTIATVRRPLKAGQQQVKK